MSYLAKKKFFFGGGANVGGGKCREGKCWGGGQMSVGAYVVDSTKNNNMDLNQGGKQIKSRTWLTSKGNNKDRGGFV